MNYPDAPRYIPATAELLDGWFGPVDRYTDADEWVLDHADTAAPEVPRAD